MEKEVVVLENGQRGRPMFEFLEERKGFEDVRVRFFSLYYSMFLLVLFYFS